MIKNDRISSLQLCFIIVAYIFGSVAISSPTRIAQQDFWISHMIGWGGGFLLITMYATIALLNPNKTLIEILKVHFGKYLGSFIGLLYVWYALHIASLITRSFGEFMVTVNYSSTPILVIYLSMLIPIVYALKKGLEVSARTNQMTIIMLIFMLLIIFVLSIPLYNKKFLLPPFEHGFKPILTGGLHLLAFPFGETVLLLMIFPCLNDQKKLVKVSNIGVLIAGFMLLLSNLRDLLVLGPDIVDRHLFPPHVSVAMMPQVVVEPIVSANLLISSGLQGFICIYCALIGIAQLLNLDDYKPFILPICSFVITLSFWIHESYPEAFTWSVKYWLPYSVPFQIIIPFILLVISIIKKKTKSTVVNE